MLGKIIHDTTTQNILSQIDLNSQPSGIYFVMIIGSKEALNKRL
jgi:hypothetical protein